MRNLKGFYQRGGDLVIISGKSSSIITDDGHHHSAANDKTLSDIVTTAFQEYEVSALSLVIRPSFTTPLHYSVQVQESAFAYAARLAMQYGEWFYYNGQQLVFGTPGNQKPIILYYGTTLKEFTLQLQPHSNNYQYFTNDYLNDEIHTKTTEEVHTGANGYHGYLSEKSSYLYHRQTKVQLHAYQDAKARKRLDQQVVLQKKATEQNQVIVEGISIHTGLVLGELVSIENAEGSYGLFRITQLTHTHTEDGKYSNTFTAVSGDIQAYPLTDIMRFPRSETQTAIVKENVDPKGMGRVKVQFSWEQEKGTTTPWIRIVSPHAGTDKGFHFIPEIGEEVLIGFEGGNAEKPYVSGSLYNGKAKPEGWKSDANDIKAIRTRSGHTIEFNDTQGEESITVIDINNNSIFIDTANDNVTVTANETITFAAKNIKMSATEHIEVQAEGNLTTTTQGDITMDAQGNATYKATGDTEMTSEGNVSVEAQAEAKLKGQNLSVEGNSAATLKGQQTKVEGQITQVKGAAGKTIYS